jgi:hypothetical protein
MMVGKRHPGPSRQAGPAAVPLYVFQPPVGTPYGLEVSTVEEFFAQHDDFFVSGHGIGDGLVDRLQDSNLLDLGAGGSFACQSVAHAASP